MSAPIASYPHEENQNINGVLIQWLFKTKALHTLSMITGIACKNAVHCSLENYSLLSTMRFAVNSKGKTETLGGGQRRDVIVPVAQKVPGLQTCKSWLHYTAGIIFHYFC